MENYTIIFLAKTADLLESRVFFPGILIGVPAMVKHYKNIFSLDNEGGVVIDKLCIYGN